MPPTHQAGSIFGGISLVKNVSHLMKHSILRNLSRGFFLKMLSVLSINANSQTPEVSGYSFRNIIRHFLHLFMLYLFGLVTIAVSAVVMTPVVTPVVTAVVTAMMPTVVIVVAVVMAV